MIVFVNPRVTKARNSRFPLSLLHLAAALPEGCEWTLVDGNRADADPIAEVDALVGKGPEPVEMVAVTVMPGPQLPSAVHFSRAIKARHPDLPLVWGGYFPTLYPDPVLRAPYVDWVVRGQGERTLVELLDALRRERDPESIAGLSFRRGDSVHRGPERIWEGPDTFPPVPFDRIDVASYLQPTILGERTGVYHASIGCPHKCNFCGVIAAYGSRELAESPARVERQLRLLSREYGMDGVHFYDNNFFLGESRALELCERITPLELAWWCEARVDTMLRYGANTWEKIRFSGLKMVFLGAESGSNESLERKNKNLKVEEIEEIARKTREFGIVPEFSFCLGDPEDPGKDVEDALTLIRGLKGINPASEIILYYYTPTPQRRPTPFDDALGAASTPDTLEEWIEPKWINWMTHADPQVPWLTGELKSRVRNFELVLRSRFASKHNRGLGLWSERLMRGAAWWRWWRGDFSDAVLLRALDRRARSAGVDRREYGHLRPAWRGSGE
ncbi:MAG: B12-binding domain-containing radical SAM protein [Gemmatimonadetes bacterium]|nr:B12-binding domain-containing radical SAM protein [Gemmatimonadota bacterium]